MRRDPNIREKILALDDELHNGIKYDKKRNIFILVWTRRQISLARRRARELRSKMIAAKVTT